MSLTRAETQETASTDLSVSELEDMEKRRVESLEENEIDESKVIAQARENIGEWEAYFKENITTGRDDQNFLLKDQWASQERSELTRLKKPALTFNKLKDMVRKVHGEQRKFKPDFMVRSLTGEAEQSQLDLRADIVRTICYNSQSDLVFQEASKSALQRGFGAYMVGIEYETPYSFDQRVVFRMIRDSGRASFDATAILPHKGDGNFFSNSYDVSLSEFQATYPYIENPVSFSNDKPMMDSTYGIKNKIIICDYFVKEWYSTLLYKLSDGTSVTREEWEDMQKRIQFQQQLAESSEIVGRIIAREIPKVIQERQTQAYKIMNYRLLNDTVIDFVKWPSKYLPGVFMDGDSSYIEGRQVTSSFIHEAKDTQRALNYTGIEIASEVKNRRREQWMATPTNIQGREHMWRNPESQQGALIYNYDTKAGPPVKVPASEMPQGLFVNWQRLSADLHEITGYSEELAGMETGSTSGKQTETRQIASSMCTYTFNDNRNQAIEQGGRIVLDLLPHVYGTDERHLVLTKKDGSSKSIYLNKQNSDGSVENMLKHGNYDVEIDVGPSFALQKAASVTLLIQLVQAAVSSGSPQVFNLVADLIAKNMDVQFMPQIAERLATLVPPEIIAKEKGLPPPPPQPNPQQQAQQQAMQQAQQQHMMQLQLQGQELKERAAELQSRQIKHQQESQLEQYKLALEAKKLQDEMQRSGMDNVVDLHKAELDHAAQMSKVMADLHKHHNPHELKEAA